MPAIVITGASSGIGRALAERYAAPGVRLGLLGRDSHRLQETETACRQRGAEVTSGRIDVRDRAGIAGWLDAFDAATPIDLLVVNAGVLGGTPPDGDIEDPGASLEVMEINVIGALNTVHPVVRRMMARRSGQIAIMSSIGGFTPLPDAPSYGASKAAMISYGLALRTLLHDSGVTVSVICPGYVTTPMTGRIIGARMGEVSAEAAATAIVDGLSKGKAVVAFPRGLALISWIGGMLPESIRRNTSRKFRFRVREASGSAAASPMRQADDRRLDQARSS